MAEPFEAELKITGAREAAQELDRVEKELDGVADSQEEVARSSKKVAGSLSDQAAKWGAIAAGVGGAVTTFKAGIGAIKGAVRAVRALASDMEETNAVINRFSGNIDEARSRTNGLVGDLDLMKASNKLAQAGINATSEEFAALTVAATENAAALGGNSTEAINRLSDAIARGGAQQLQKLGIDITDVTDRAERKRVALERLEEKFGDMSSSADTAAGKLDELGTMLDNTKLAMFRVADAALKAGEETEGLGKKAKSTHRDVSLLEQSVVAAELGLVAMTKGVDAARKAHEEWTKTVIGSVELTEEAQKRVDLFGDSMDELIPIVTEAGGVTNEMSDRMHDLGITFEDLSKSQIPVFLDSLRDIIEEEKRLSEEIERQQDLYFGLRVAAGDDDFGARGSGGRDRQARRARRKSTGDRAETLDDLARELRGESQETGDFEGFAGGGIIGRAQLAQAERARQAQAEQERRIRDAESRLSGGSFGDASQQTQDAALPGNAELQQAIEGGQTSLRDFDRTIRSAGEAQFGFGDRMASTTSAMDDQLQRVNDMIATYQRVGVEVPENLEKVQSALQSATNDAKAQADAVRQQGGAWLETGANVASSAVGMAKSLGASSKAIAAVQAVIETARGIADLATGTWPPNPASLAASAGHFLSAAMFAKLAGSSGGGKEQAKAKMGGGGGGGAPSSPSTRPEGARRGSDQGGVTNVININSPVPEEQLGRMVNRASKAATRRF